MVVFRNRYMVMEMFVDPKKKCSVPDPIILTHDNLSELIRNSINANFGECCTASSSFQVKYVNPITNLCIIRTSRDDYQKVWAAISLIRTIKGYDIVFNLLNLTGTIRVCKETALKCDEVKFEWYKLAAKAGVSVEVNEKMLNCLERIKLLDH